MYYPPLFTPVRPFESRPNSLGGPIDVPVVGATVRENPLDLSTKTIRQTPDSGAEAEATELLMLDHRKLANLAASHSLSAMGRQLVPGAAPASILDPSLYRLAYGPEALAVPAPFCYDRATGVAVSTSLAGHQLMNNFLQQREQRCLEQQQALLAARTSAQQAAFMEQAALPYSLRNAMTPRDAAALLNVARGVYAPAMPTPMVLPAFSLYTDDKGAFTSLRNGSATEKAYLNGTTPSGSLDVGRYAEHLQRINQQTGKCNNACCASLPGLAATVPCACCMQSPSQAALCARSPIGCLKDPATAATGKVCSTACDYLQPGLTYLHRPTAATAAPSDLRLHVPSFGSTSFTSASAEVTSSAPVFQPATTWSTGLPSVSTPGKTAFSVPKKKDVTKVSPSQKEGKVLNGFYEKERHNSQETFKRDSEKFNLAVKKEPNRSRDEKDVIVISEAASSVSSYQRKEHDVKSMLTPKTTSSLVVPRTIAQQAGTAQTTVTAVTPIVPTKCEGGTIPKTKLPPVLEPYRPVDILLHNGEHFTDAPTTVPSPQGPPPLIAVANRSSQHQTTTSCKDRYPFSTSDSNALRHQALLHGTAMPTSVKSSSVNNSIVPSHLQKPQKSPKKSSCQPKSNGLPCYVKEEPSAKQIPPITIPKPVPQIPTAHHISNAHYTSPYRPFSLQSHPSWIPPANPNVTVSPTVPLPKAVAGTTAASVATTASAITVGNHKVVKSEPLPVINVKKEPDYEHNANVLQSLLVRPGHPHQAMPAPGSCLPPVQHNPASVIMPNPSSYSILDYHQYHQQMGYGLNLSQNSHEINESSSPAAACTAPVEKQEPKVECGNGLECISAKQNSARKRLNDTPIKTEDPIDEKKRISKVEYTMAPGYAFQYPPFGISEAKEPPLCPYTFVPEPPGYYENQMVVPKEIRPLKATTCHVPKPLDAVEPLAQDGGRSESHQESPSLAPAPTLSLRVNLHLKSIRRSAQARARSKFRKRVLARIYHANSRRKAEMLLARPVEPCPQGTTIVSRRYLYKIGKRRRIKSGLDMALKRNKNKRRGVVYKIRRQNSNIGAAKKAKQPAVVSMPAEMRKLMVNKALGETVLHCAARRGNPAIVAFCLETNCSNVNAQDNAGYTPLHECCSRGHLDIARALLQYGANVNASAAGGIRPIHDAVENDHVEIVRLLLSFGADPTIATYSGLTPMKLARSPLMAEFLQGFMADISGDVDSRPHLPWRFWGSARCLDPQENGYDMFDGVPSDGEAEVMGEGDDFLFEVSDSPHLPTFRLALLPTSSTSKAQSNYLRLSDVLRKTSMSRNYFLEHYRHIEVLSVPRHEFEASATCSQLLTGSKLDTLFASRTYSDGLDSGNTVDLVRLDNNIRKVLGIETISVR